jgi:DNA-binding CsgD family transcriptional regulator
MPSPTDSRRPHLSSADTGDGRPSGMWWPGRTGPDTVIEREGQLAAAQRLVADTLGGRCTLVTVHGLPGTGRTTLLCRIATLAEQAGLRAVGVQCPVTDRRTSGSALAQLRVALTPPDHPVWTEGPEDGADPFAATDALVAPEGAPADVPLALLVDDAQWADPESARWLWTLVRRLPDVPMLVVLAFNSVEPAAFRPIPDGTAGRASGRGVDTVALAVAPLSAAGVRTVVEQTCRVPADDMFAHAAVHLTAGNPAVLCEALARFGPGGAPVGGFVPVFAEAVTETRCDQVTRILDGLPEESVALLRAVAVSGEALEMPLVCQLAELRGTPPAAAASVLLRTGLVPDADRPLAVDPDVADRVLAAMDVQERRSLHARAASLGRRALVPDEALSRMLLHAGPIAQEWAVPVLRRAAAGARAEGRYGLAAELLGRALSEPASEAVAAELLVELGTTEAWLSSESGDRRLRQVLLDTTGPDAGPHRLTAADILLCRGDSTFAQRAITAVRRRTDITDSERGGLLGLYWLTEHNQHGQPELAIPGVPVLPESPTDPIQACVVAGNLGAHGTDIARSRELARAAMSCWAGDERLLSPRIAAARALSLADDLAEAVEALDEVITDARRRGIRAAIGLAMVTRADVLLRWGRLDDAAQGLNEVLGEIHYTAWHPALLPKMVAIEVELNVELGLLDQAEQAAATPLRAGAESGVGWTRMLFARGMLDLAAGRPDDAIAFLRETGRRMSASQWTNPASMLWRSLAAAAHHAAGRSETAARLTEEEIRNAERWGAPTTVGRVHLYAGLIADGPLALQHLRSAVDLLRECPDRLRYAQSVIELATAALGSQEERPSVAPLLREASDLVARNGWHHLVPRLEELSRQYYGVSPLSEAQLRVAELAAEGISNAVIATMLSVTRRTVELHLTNVYRKLGIAGRDELAAALGRTGPGI